MPTRLNFRHAIVAVFNCVAHGFLALLFRCVAGVLLCWYVWLQFEASWVLVNLVSGTSVHCHYVLSLGALAPLMSLLSSPEEDCREQVTVALRVHRSSCNGCDGVILCPCRRCGLWATSVATAPSAATPCCMRMVWSLSCH